MATPAGKKRAQNVEETENNTSPDKRKMKKQKVQGAGAAGAAGGAAGAAAPAAGAAAAGKGKGDAKKKAATAAAIAAISGAAAAAPAAGAGAGAGLTKKQKKAQKAKAAAAEAPAKRPAAAAAAAAADDDGDDDDAAGAFDDGPLLDQLQAVQKSLDRVDAKYQIEKLRIEQKMAAEKKDLLAARADAIKGVAGFWKTALLGADSLRSVLHPEVDMKILDALTELTVKPLTGAAGVGYTITFAFDASVPLPFTNAKLERTYKFVPLNEQKPAAAAAATEEEDDDGAPAPECRVSCGPVQWRDPTFGVEEDKESFFREFFDGEKCKDDNSEDIIGSTIAEVYRNPLPFFLDGLNPDGDVSEDDMDDDDDGASADGADDE